MYSIAANDIPTPKYLDKLNSYLFLILGTFILIY